MKTKSLVIWTFLFVIFLTSCSNDPVTPGQGDINGQVGYDFGYLPNAKVEIEGKVTTTDDDGRFTIPDVTIPYDLKVMTSNGLDVIVMKGLSHTEPFVNFEAGYIQPTSKQSASIISTLDSMPASNERSLAIFIPDDGQPQVLSYYHTGQALNEIRTDIYWIGGPVVKGKVVILIFSVFENKIVKFNEYYEKNLLTIHDNSVDSLRFGFPSAIPITTTVSGTVDNYSGTPAHIRMSLKFKNSLTQLPLEQRFGAFVYSFSVPGNIPEPFDIEVVARDNDQLGRKIVQSNSHNNIIKIYRPVDLVSPKELDSVTYYRTPFSWDPVIAGPGLYELKIENHAGAFRRIRVISASQITTIPDLSQIGYNHIGGGVTYRWRVSRIFGLPDINDFVDGNFRNNIGFQGNTICDPRLVRVY